MCRKNSCWQPKGGRVYRGRVPRRIKEADYPNAEELRLVADHFRLSYPDLQVRFGLMSHDEVISYIQSAPLAVATAAPAVPKRATKLSEMTRRADAPPL